MKGGLRLGGKRELLSRALFWSGVSSLLWHLPARDSLLVLNYHRIGNPDEDLFDPGVFSATSDEFDDQVSHLKKHLSPVTLDEALAFVEGSSRDKTGRCRTLITFDDGYLDNYEVAFPILHSHGVQGVFFLATSMVGSCHVPWWDEIAYLVKTAQRQRFSLRYPAELEINLDGNGQSESLRAILRSFKNPANTNSERFLQELKEASLGEDPPKTERRFLSWDEAREMSKAGMAFGSHTHSHCVLSQLDPGRQYEELSTSRKILKEQLGIEADALAYPVGGKTSFTEQTQRAAKEAGYRAAFSFYGGKNLAGATRQYDVSRIGIDGQSRSRFRTQTAVCRISGNFWP